MKTFFLGMENELLIVKETVDGYKSSSHLQGMRPTCLCFDPQTEHDIYCGTDNDGLFKSSDGGETWTRIGGTGILSAKVTAVAAGNNGVIYAGTEPSRLFYSKDKGATWAETEGLQTLPSKEYWSFPPRPETHFVRWITPGFDNPDVIGVSIEAGAFLRSEDGGRTWIDRPEDSPKDTHTLLAHPDAPGRLYSASGDRAYAESIDYGRSWTYMNEGLGDFKYLYHMVINPQDPNDRIVSASKSARDAHGAHYSTVFRKIGDGSWKEFADGLPRKGAYTQVLAADYDTANIFYALTNHGVFKLDADDTKWHKLDIKWDADYINQQPRCFAVRDY